MTRASRQGVVVSAAVLAIVLSSDVSAQQAPELQPRHLTASVGAAVLGGYPIGAVDGTLRRNVVGAPSPFTLLRAESEIERAAAFEARVAVALSRTFEIEAGGVYATPQLTVTVSQDAELDGAASASETLAHYAFEVSGVYLIPRVTLGARMRPYLIGGGGYLRQLHEGRLRLETGSTIHAGGGVRYWLRGGAPRQRAAGLRAEARYVRRAGGIEFAGASRAFPSVSLLAFIGF
jgi:hypothetical protein